MCETIHYVFVLLTKQRNYSPSSSFIVWDHHEERAVQKENDQIQEQTGISYCPSFVKNTSPFEDAKLIKSEYHSFSALVSPRVTLRHAKEMAQSVDSTSNLASNPKPPKETFSSKQLVRRNIQIKTSPESSKEGERLSSKQSSHGVTKERILSRRNSKHEKKELESSFEDMDEASIHPIPSLPKLDFQGITKQVPAWLEDLRSAR